jgi:hypothetical protein
MMQGVAERTDFLIGSSMIHGMPSTGTVRKVHAPGWRHVGREVIEIDAQDGLGRNAGVCSPRDRTEDHGAPAIVEPDIDVDLGTQRPRSPPLRLRG